MLTRISAWKHRHRGWEKDETKRRIFHHFWRNLHIGQRSGGLARIGLDSFSYHLHLEDLDHPRDAFWFIQKTLDYGLNGCSFNPKHLRGWDEELILGIGRLCRQHGLYLELTTSGSDYARLCRRLILASEVGARILRTSVSEHRYASSQDQRKVLFQFAIENLKRLSEVAECVGVVLALSRDGDMTTAETVDVVKRVDSPYVRACYCNAEVLGVWEEPLESAAALAPYLAGVLLKDWRCLQEDGAPVYESCVLGDGHARVGDVYLALRRLCPKVPITLEIATIGPGLAFHSLDEEESHVRQSLEFIRTLDQGPVLVR